MLYNLMELSFRRFLESDAYPTKPGSGGSPFDNPGPKTMDHTGTINFEFGSTDQDQAQASPYVGSGIQAGSKVMAGLPSFQVLSINDKTVTVRMGDVGNKVINRHKDKEDGLDPNPEEQEGKVITIPRWQYERMITRGLDQQGGAPPPPGTGMM